MGQRENSECCFCTLLGEPSTPLPRRVKRAGICFVPGSHRRGTAPLRRTSARCARACGGDAPRLDSYRRFTAADRLPENAV